MPAASGSVFQGGMASTSRRDPVPLQIVPQARDALDSVAMDEDGGELPLSIEDGAMPPVDLSGYDNPLVVVILFEVTAHAAA